MLLSPNCLFRNQQKKTYQKQYFKQSNLLIHKHHTRLTLLKTSLQWCRPSLQPERWGQQTNPQWQAEHSSPLLKREPFKVTPDVRHLKLWHCAVYAVKLIQKGKRCLPANTSAGAGLAGAEVKKS